MNRIIGFVTSLSLIGFSSAVLSQPAPPPNAKVRPKPDSQNRTQVGRNPAATYLMNEYGIPESEALERIEVQNEVLALSERLNVENDPAFTDVWIEHVPAFKVVVGFADN